MTPWSASRSLILLSLVASAFSCGGDSTTTGPPAGPRNGTLSIQMHDAPFDEAQAVLVTFSEVSAHRSTDAGFQRLPFAEGAATRTCDLKKMENGLTELLGVGALPDGHYTQLRLTIVDAHLYFENKTNLPACSADHPIPGGRSREVTIPSGDVRLAREFDVKEGATTAITLDFDGEKSIHGTSAAGQFIMDPVIRVVSVDGP